VVSIEEARQEFSPTGIYCDTASLGLAARSTVHAVEQALQAWHRGEVAPPQYDQYVDRSRELYASLTHTTPDRVAVGSQVSVFSDVVARSLRPGDEVLVAREDFTSVLFPFLAQEPRGVVVRSVPLDDLIGEINDRTALVAVSAVQSADGRVLDLESVATVAEQHGAATYLDTTQAIGWYKVEADRFTFTICHAYKWLCSPRGSAFFTVAPDALTTLGNHNSGWYGGADVWTSIYGPPLRLAQEARRLDLSPAWLSWVGTAAALELIAAIGVDVIRAHDVSLANELREAVGLPAGNSAIVWISLPDVDAAVIQSTLAAAEVRCAIRAGGVRIAFHHYNTSEDAATVAAALSALM
jgi:selenocysteine lyase/cysteine desulfurase